MKLLDLFVLSGLMNFIFSLFWGLMVFSKKRTENINQIFLLLSLCVAFWSLGYYFWLSSTSYQGAYLGVIFLTLFSIFIPVTFYHWVLLLIDFYNNKQLKLMMFIFYILSVIIVFIGLFKPNYLVTNLKYKIIFPFWPEAGILYTFYIIFLYTGIILFSTYLIIRKYKLTESRTEKNKLLFLLISIVIGFGGGFTNFPLWYNIKIMPWGNFLVFSYVLILGYATLEWKFFNIKILGTEFFVFTLLILLSINLLRSLLIANYNLDFFYNLIIFLLTSILGFILRWYAYKESEQREKLEELNRIKSEFLSFASHQVKSPMAVVKGYAELIAEEIENVPEQAKDFAKKIKDSVNNLLELVEEFMDYRRIEEGKLELNFEEVEIVSLIKEIINNFQLIAKEKNLELIFDSQLEQFIIKADKMKITQVIQNLVDNALKYTPQGWVKISLSKDNDNILITVADSGIGMSKELQSKLFGEFVRDPSIKREIRGTGLGLYIAKNIVEAHQGKIWAESEGEGKGSKFFIKLPKEIKI